MVTSGYRKVYDIYQMEYKVTVGLTSGSISMMSQDFKRANYEADMRLTNCTSKI